MKYKCMSDFHYVLCHFFSLTSLCSCLFLSSTATRVLAEKVSFSEVSKCFSPGAQSISPVAIFGDCGSMIAMNSVTT